MNYGYQSQGDTIKLGIWYYGDYLNLNDTYFQPYLTQSNDSWNFGVKEIIHQSNPVVLDKEENKIRSYKNFDIVNNQELVFKNGAGSLILNRKIDNKQLHIIEKEQQIYILDGVYFGNVYMSFDAGTTWLCYPLPLEKQNYNLRFLSINDRNELNHFSNEWSNPGRAMLKIFNHFTPVK